MFSEKVLNSFDKNEHVSRKICINCNFVNFFVFVFAVLSQIGMRKIFAETDSDYEFLTSLIFGIILFLCILNFRIQKKKAFYWINSINIALLCFNVYLYLFKIIGL